MIPYQKRIITKGEMEEMNDDRVDAAPESGSEEN